MPTRLLMTVSLAILAGCGASGTNNTTAPENWDGRYTYEPCETITTPDAQKRSLVALLKALDENAWEVESANQVINSVIAKGCQLPLLVDCETASFSVDLNGVITARPARRHFHADLRDAMYRWLAHLEETFNKWRCSDEEILKRQAAKYDLDF